jgi:hypothetical protein
LTTHKAEGAGTRAIDVAGETPSRWTTRATQKVREAELVREKLKGKGKAKVDDELFGEARREKLEKLKAERAVIQAMIDQLEL